MYKNLMSSTNIGFKLLSLNVRGIRNYDKRKAIFLWISKQNADVIFLQETSSTKEVEHFGDYNGKVKYSLLTAVNIPKVFIGPTTNRKEIN